VGKKKDKAKPKQKEVVEGPDRPRRKELAREVERLQAQNEALRARLDRIAEIASADPEMAADPTMAVVLDTQES
jgi:hypothetical protein